MVIAQAEHRDEGRRQRPILLLLVAGLALGLVLVAFLTVLVSPVEGQGACDRWVVTGGSDLGSDCSNEQQPCATVQHAINESADQDVICVADRSDIAGPTVYYELIRINSSISLDARWTAECSPTHPRCSFKAASCEPSLVVLDAQAKGRVVTINGQVRPAIQCFTITGGNADGLGGDPDGDDAGGGIFSNGAAPRITGNSIRNNYGCRSCPAGPGSGGGIYLLDAPSQAGVVDNEIASNIANNKTWGAGGGMMLRDSDAVVMGNRIRDNRAGTSAGTGGGIAVMSGSPTIFDNEVLQNVAGQSYVGGGGGIFVRSDEPVVVEGNVISGNLALSGPGDPHLESSGGGLAYLGNPTVVAWIVDNEIRGNVAAPIGQEAYGGGIYLRGLVAPSMVSGNDVQSNIACRDDDGDGGGIYVEGSEVTLYDNTLLNNSATWAGDRGEGGGLFITGGEVMVQNNLIHGNHGVGMTGLPGTTYGFGGGIAITGSLTTVQDNWIAANYGTRSDGVGLGGGVYALEGRLKVNRNTIASNLASEGDIGRGGGLYLQDVVEPSLDANTIVGNLAAGGTDGRGGGLRLVRSEMFTLTNNIIVRNAASYYGSGVAIIDNCRGILAHNTIAENADGDGSGVHVAMSSTASLLNNIIVDQSTGILNDDLAGSSVGAVYTLFEGNGADYSAGVLSSLEVPGPAGLLPDFHLSSTSNAIDQAPPLAWVDHDIDGDSRPVGAASDCGADERAFRVHLPLVFRSE